MVYKGYNKTYDFSRITLLKGRKMVPKSFESGIFSNLKESQPSEETSNNVKYNSFGYDTYILSKKLKDV